MTTKAPSLSTGRFLFQMISDMGLIRESHSSGTKMTLVAARRVAGVPVLMGDFLLTEKAPIDRLFLPTRMRVLPDGVPPPPRMLSKKIHRISDGFVIGFAGLVTAGALLIREIYGRFGGVCPSASEVQSFLASFDFPGKSETTLVGWICDATKWRSFSWRGDEPSALVLDEVVSGSGREHFMSAIEPADSAAWGGGLDLAVERAEYKSVCKISKLLAAEISHGRNLASDYGFGGEVLVWNGVRFRYVDDIAYTFWNVRIDEFNRISIAPAEVMLRYKSFDRFSVMQTTHMARVGSGFQAQHTFVQPILPIDLFGLEPEQLSSELDIDNAVGRIGMNPALWCSAFFVVNLKTRASGLVNLASEAKDGGLIEYKDNHIFINMGEIREMIDTRLFT